MIGIQVSILSWASVVCLSPLSNMVNTFSKVFSLLVCTHSDHHFAESAGFAQWGCCMREGLLPMWLPRLVQWQLLKFKNSIKTSRNVFYYDSVCIIFHFPAQYFPLVSCISLLAVFCMGKLVKSPPPSIPPTKYVPGEEYLTHYWSERKTGQLSQL